MRNELLGRCPSALDGPQLAVDYGGVDRPLTGMLAAWMAWRSLATTRDWHPFVWTLAIFALSMIGLAISIWPDVIPGRVTIWQAAAPETSQMFMLVGSAVLIPLILAYTAWSYYVFRGKVGEEGYHEH